MVGIDQPPYRSFFSLASIPLSATLFIPDRSLFLFSATHTMTYSLWIYFFSLVTPPLSFFLFFPFYFFLLQKVGKCKVGKEEWQIVATLFFPHPSDNLVTASLFDSFARSSSNPNFPGYLCVSCSSLPQCWHPRSLFQISLLTAPSRPHLSLVNLLRAILSSTRILSKRQTSSLLPSLQFAVQLIS